MLPPRAYTFIGLNIVRALSIIGLLLVFSSSIFVMVQDIRAVNTFTQNKQSGNSTTTDHMLNCDYIMGSTVPNQPAGVFWAILNRLLVIFQVVVLIFSELGWPASFFDRFFPVLGNNFGLGALGVVQCLIGAAVLSHHVDDFALVSAFFLFSIGCLNILIGLIFRQSAKIKRSLTSWKDHAKSVLPTHVAGVEVKPVMTGVSSLFKGSEKDAGYPEPTFAGYGYGRRGEKAAAAQGYLLSKPLESLPRYAPKRSASPQDRPTSPEA